MSHRQEAIIIKPDSRQVLDHPDAIWQFFIEHRIESLVFLIEEALGTCEDIPLNTLGDMNRYIQFLQRILELRDACENPPFVREIDLLKDMQLFYLLWRRFPCQ